MANSLSLILIYKLWSLQGTKPLMELWFHSEVIFHALLLYYPTKILAYQRCPGWDPEGSSCFSCLQNIPEVLYKCLVRIDGRLDLKTSLVRKTILLPEAVLSVAQGFVDRQGLSSLVMSTSLKRLLHSFYK